MPNLIWIFVLVHLICGILAYGGTLAYFQRKYETVSSYADAGIAFWMGLLGPIGLAITFLSSNFFAYGLKFVPENSEWARREAKERKKELADARKKYWSRNSRPF